MTEVSAQTHAHDALALRARLIADLRMSSSAPPDDEYGSGVSTRHTTLSYSELTALAAESTVMIWRSETYHLALRGSEVFLGREPSLIQPQFWYLPFPNKALESEMPTEAESDLDRRTVALMIAHSREGHTLIYMVKGRSSGIHSVVLRWNHLYPTTDSQAWKHQIVAGLEFQKQKIAALERVSAPRALRRRAEREHQELPEVRIIQLRGRESSGQGKHGEREYRHRWLVRGHWRRLHEPRKGDGAEVAFVQAHIKGPESAPFLQPRESVYAVAR